ncbi:hypothetical protein PFISCL1PPCAC_4388, partial [Pristionchus fissidentatus]
LASMPSVVTAQSRARNARLAAGREYAAEVVQHCELQENPRLEEKILGDLSGIVLEAVDCLRNDQPFRSSSLSMLSLELLSYLRLPNKPMLVNFACAFTMLMSELEGIDLAERPRSYSNSIPDVQPDTSLSSTERASALLPSSSSLPSTSGSTPVASVFHASPAPRQQPASTTPVLNLLLGGGVVKEEEGRESVGLLDFESMSPEEPLGKVEDDLRGDEAMAEGGLVDSSGYDDSLNASIHDEAMQLMAANFSATNSNANVFDLDLIKFRSMAAKFQKKSHTGKFESRDGELAAFHKLPVTAEDIENMSEPSLQQLLLQEDLTEEQREVIRLIRRRARNKLSSREYRKRHSAAKKYAYEMAPASSRPRFE